MSVAVVTDSTADLPAALCARFGVQVVPLRVDVGGRAGFDGVDVSRRDVVTALRSRVPVVTSRPSPAAFAAAYRQALDTGADHVVSVHLSAALSGTWDSARLAAEDFGQGTVRVVDSRSTAMALGFAVISAAEAAGEGLGAAEVQEAAVVTVGRTRSLFYVDTLEHLRRGGRIGTAAAVLGSSLSVKPLLHVEDGRIRVLEKVRTSSKAVARLVALTVESAGSGPVDVAVHHLDRADRAASLCAELRAALPGLREITVSEVGPVVGAHIGPGMLGTVVVRR